MIITMSKVGTLGVGVDMQSLLVFVDSLMLFYLSRVLCDIGTITRPLTRINDCTPSIGWATIIDHESLDPRQGKCRQNTSPRTH